MRRALLGLFAFSPILTGGACDQAGTTLLPSVGDGLPPTCSPLRTPGACMMPWPNAIYLQANATTVTGYSLALTPETLPVVATTGEQLDPSRWNMADGFSPAGPIIDYFAEPIDPASLVPETNIGASLQPGAATVLVDMATGARVAHFSGVDENVVKDGDRQALLITPATRLQPNHRYAVAITSAVRTTAGSLPTPPPLFQAIASGTPPTDPLSQAEAARMPAILAALAAAGVPGPTVVVAWDFVTGSDEALTGHVLSMRDQALAERGSGYSVTGVDENLDAQVLRRIRGTFSVPQFLDNADESQAEAQLVLDPAGNPQLVGTYQAPFTIIVPAVAATKGPLPVVVYGHGLFGTGEDELGGSTGSYVQDFANLEGYVIVATDWIGLSAHESPLTAGNNQALAYALTDFSKFPWITDRLQQALVNTMVLERTMVGSIVNDAAMTVSGQAGGMPIADPTRVFYYGISLGGIMGLSFMGYDPDITRGVLGCGGGFWSTLFQRSVNWKEASVIVPASYPDSLDGQLLLALAQMQFDYTDPATVAPYVLGAKEAPLSGVPRKQLLMQMGLDDAQVANVTTEMIARTCGIPVLSRAVTDIDGVTPVPGPLSSALTTWDVHGTPVPPDTNQTPAEDNQVHEAIRRIPQAEQQIQTFYATGHVVDVCDAGPCVEPVPPTTPEAGL
jgi:dienelactone hydrolase